MNAVNEGANRTNLLTAAEMRAAAELPFDQMLKPEADVSLTMSFDFYAVNNSMFHKGGLYGFRQGTYLDPTPTYEYKYITYRYHIYLVSPIRIQVVSR